MINCEHARNHDLAAVLHELIQQENKGETQTWEVRKKLTLRERGREQIDRDGEEDAHDIPPFYPFLSLSLSISPLLA